MTVPLTSITLRVAVHSPQRLLRDTLAACLAIRRKLGVRNRAGALAVADAFGLLRTGDQPASV